MPLLCVCVCENEKKVGNTKDDGEDDVILIVSCVINMICLLGSQGLHRNQPPMNDRTVAYRLATKLRKQHRDSL